MKKTLIYRNLLLGLLSWLIPFMVSFFCYIPEGQLRMEYGAFKSVTMISGTLSGSYLLYHFFRVVNVDFILNGIVVGLSYLAIPVLSIAMGYLLNKKVKTVEYGH